jgi:peptidyl-tRNA hydrolase, PTH1 family
MKLIVGLGNPGKRYQKTRHNVGFMVLDALRAHFKYDDISDWEVSKKFNAAIAGCTVKGEKIILAKPMTFMNHSGQAVGLVAHYYKIPIKDIIVVHDDKDLPLGRMKVDTGRGHAGHNGVRSIMELLQKKDLCRVRVGIAHRNEKRMGDTAKFVLGKFGLLEKKQLDKAVASAKNEILSLLA